MTLAGKRRGEPMTRPGGEIERPCLLTEHPDEILQLAVQHLRHLADLGVAEGVEQVGRRHVAHARVAVSIAVDVDPNRNDDAGARIGREELFADRRISDENCLDSTRSPVIFRTFPW